MNVKPFRELVKIANMKSTSPGVTAIRINQRIANTIPNKCNQQAFTFQENIEEICQYGSNMLLIAALRESGSAALRGKMGEEV